VFGCQCQCQSDYQYCSGSESTVISTSVGQEHGQDRGLDGLVWVLRYARCGFSVLYVHYTTHISHVVCTVQYYWGVGFFSSSYTLLVPAVGLAFLKKKRKMC